MGTVQRPRVGSFHLTPVNLSPAEREQDDALERELVLLLSELEQHRNRLADPVVQQRPQASLLTIQAILQRFTTFIEKNLDTAPANDVLAVTMAKTGELIGSVQTLTSEYGSTTLQSLFSLFGKTSSGDKKRSQTYKQVTRGLLAVLEVGLASFHRRFHLAATGREWDQTQRLFLDDLTRVLERLQG